MHQFSDSDTPDSDDGRRFKTESTRPKKDVAERQYRRYRSPSPCRRNYLEKRRKSRSRSPNRYDRSKRRSDERYRDESRRYSRYDDDKDERKRGSKENSVTKEKRDSGEKDTSSNYTKKIDLKKELEEKKSCGPTLPRVDDTKKNLNVENDMVEEKSYGPILPSKKSNNFKDSESSEKNDSTSYGPSLPQNLVNTKSDLEDSYGPSLPPASSSKTQPEPTDKIIGPSLPEHLREKLAKASENVNFENVEINEDDIKSENEYDIKSDDDDNEIIGPLPPNMLPTQSQIELEERALQIKINNLTAKTNETKREEWMMELPEVKAIGLGLGPRQFRPNPGPDMSDRSSWTDTPKDKLKKQSPSNQERDLKKEAEYKELKRRDEEQEKIIKKHKKSSKRDDKSLLEMHQSKIEKKKGEPVERRPFNREIDLKVNRFDEAQKKAILKKAQLLDDRFSSGQAKYL